MGGECDYFACIPSKTLLRPGDALHAAREAPGAREAVTGQLDPAATFEWRNFMVADYDDAGKAGGSRATASSCCAVRRGSPGRAASLSTTPSTPRQTS